MMGTGIEAVVASTTEKGKIRSFDTGATRDTEVGKPDYEGFLSPLVIARYGEYMNAHRVQSDGKLRDSDNWQKGIPMSAYMKSGWRHFFDWWSLYRRMKSGNWDARIEEALCALMFNVMGYLHEHLRRRAAAEAVLPNLAGTLVPSMVEQKRVYNRQTRAVEKAGVPEGAVVWEDEHKEGPW